MICQSCIFQENSQFLALFFDKLSQFYDVTLQNMWCVTCLLRIGLHPRVKGLCMYVLHSIHIHSTEEQVLRSLAPQILKTGSVDSWLPSFAHGHPIQTYHPSVLGNAQGSRVQVRSKCPMHYSCRANGGLGLGFIDFLLFPAS